MWISVTWPSHTHTHTRERGWGGGGEGQVSGDPRFLVCSPAVFPSPVSVQCTFVMEVAKLWRTKSFFLRWKYRANKQLGRRKLISHVFCPAASIKLPWRLFKVMGYLAAQLLAKTITGPKGSDPFRSNERINEWIKILKTTCHLPVTAA